MPHEPITDLLASPVDLIQLVHVVLVGAQCLVVYIFEAAVRAEGRLRIREPGLLQAEELLAVDSIEVSDDARVVDKCLHGLMSLSD